MRTKFLLETLKGTDHLGDVGIEGSIILKWILKKQVVRVYSGLNWLSIESSGGML
jgi:hypothetical protein